MLTIFIRTLIIYGSLIITMRFMGKRQLGELEVSELVTTFLLSEVASAPLTNNDTPISYALIPILTLTSLEVVLSGALLKLPFLKKIFSVRPAILLKDGKPDRAALASMRISADELMSQLRQKDVTDPGELAYAILEPNGQISVVKKATQRQATTRELGVEATETGFMHLIVVDGQVNERNLTLAGKDRRWLTQTLEAHKLPLPHVFLLMADDTGQVRIFPRKEKAS